MIHPRKRMAAIAGSVALSLSMALAPAVMAQDSPEATIQGFMDAVVEKDFDALAGYFCEAEASQAAQFDMSAVAGDFPEDFDVQALLDAFIFEISLDELEVMTQSDTEAVVQVVGSMAMDLDQEALVPFVEAVIEMSGMEVDEATVAMFMDIVASEFEAQAETIDGDVTLVPGDDGWLICSDLDFGSGESADDDMSDDDMSDDDMSDDDMSDDDMSDDDMSDEEDGE
jgi:hypothetical protein